MSNSVLERLNKAHDFGKIKERTVNANDHSQTHKNVDLVLDELKSDTNLYAQRLTKGEMGVQVRDRIAKTLTDTTVSEQDRIFKSVMDHLFGYSIFQPLMDDPEISDIQVCGPYYTRFVKGQRELFANNFQTEEELLYWVDTKLKSTPFSYNRSDARVDAFLADGSRIHIKGETTGVNMLEYKGQLVKPPSTDEEYLTWMDKARNGGKPVVRPATIVTIRKFLGYFTLEELVKKKMFDERVFAYLDLSSKIRDGFILSGGTGCGKTTIMNALVGKTEWRREVGILEEAPEMNPLHPNIKRFWERPENAKGIGRIGTDLNLKDTLRMFLDDLFVGEVRDAIMAYQFLQAANTGSGRVGTTLHASSADGAVERFMTLASSSPERLGQTAVWDNMKNTIKVVMQLERIQNQRRMTEIAEIDPKAQLGEVRTIPVFTFHWTGLNENGLPDGYLQFHGLTERFQKECAKWGLAIPSELKETKTRDFA